MKFIENQLVQLSYNDEMYITFQKKILLHDSRLLKTFDEIGGKIIKKSWGKTQSAKYELVNLGSVEVINSFFVYYTTFRN